MGERWLCKPEVGGSSPPTSTIHFLTFPAIKGTNRRPTGAGGRIPPHQFKPFCLALHFTVIPAS